MADIIITRKHGLSPDAVKAEIERLATDLTTRMDGSWRWEGDVAVCEIRGARGRVQCQGDQVTMEVTLPLMLKMFKGPLEAEIDRQFSKHFVG